MFLIAAVYTYNSYLNTLLKETKRMSERNKKWFDKIEREMKYFLEYSNEHLYQNKQTSFRILSEIGFLVVAV